MDKHKRSITFPELPEAVTFVDNNSTGVSKKGGPVIVESIARERIGISKTTNAVMLPDIFPKDSNLYTPISVKNNSKSATVLVEKVITTATPCEDCGCIHTLRLASQNGQRMCLRPSMLNPNSKGERADLNLVAAAFCCCVLGKRVTIDSLDKDMNTTFENKYVAGTN